MHYSIVAAYDWKCIHDEGFLIYEVAEVFGNVRCSLLNALCPYLWLAFFTALDFSRGSKRRGPWLKMSGALLVACKFSFVVVLNIPNLTLIMYR